MKQTNQQGQENMQLRRKIGEIAKSIQRLPDAKTLEEAKALDYAFTAKIDALYQLFEEVAIAEMEKKMGKCGWHQLAINDHPSRIVGRLESASGKWFDCCQRCWKKRKNSDWNTILKLGAERYE